MNDKLTVIVPVYNVENYISSCLDSIARQDYSPLEVFLVDDGSPDGSAEICEEMALKDDRFCVIHKKNGGLSGARNSAILISDSERITFVDSDDALIGQPYSYLMEALRTSDADIVSMKRYSSSEPLHEVRIDMTGVKQEISGTKLYEMICMQTASEAAWDKVYRTDIFENLLFCEGTLNEDFLFLIKLLSSQEIHVLRTDYLGYYYYLRAGSITGSGFKKNMVDSLYNAHFALKNIPSRECEYAAEYYMLHTAFGFFVNMPKEYIDTKNKDYIFARQCVCDLKKKLLKSACKKREKIILLMLLYMPKAAKKYADLYMKRIRPSYRR